MLPRTPSRTLSRRLEYPANSGKFGVRWQSEAPTRLCIKRPRERENRSHNRLLLTASFRDAGIYLFTVKITPGESLRETVLTSREAVGARMT
jgi:hypothetical protein